MIVLDLEWNRGYDKRPLNEILQIGAVRLDGPGGPIRDTFNACIRPVVHKKFDPGASALPELSASRTSELDFPGALLRFRRWCGEETLFAAWGSGDVNTLSENCGYWSLPPFSAQRTLDLQRAFSRRLGTDRQIALWRAVEYCGIPDCFVFHNALHDAMYAALLSAWLTDEKWFLEPDPKQAAPQLSTLPFPRQPRKKVGPLPQPEDVLNARDSRRPPCPLCGQKGAVLSWHFPVRRRPGGPQQYYGVFSCPRHGRFLCRLTLWQTDSGLWCGRRAVPVVTPETVSAWTAAFRGGSFQCQGKRRRRRRT